MDALLLPISAARAGTIFGYPPYYVGRKLFACIYGDSFGVRVPESMASVLGTRRQILPFQPMGKTRMREWLQINRTDSAEYRLDMDVLRAALEYSRQLNEDPSS